MEIKAAALVLLCFLTFLVSVECGRLKKWVRCPYQGSKYCHNALPSMVYENARIYTVDPADNAWDKYSFLFN
jgi:hypothetical protein